MTLFEGKIKKEYLITGIYVEAEITRRLEALGFNAETKITIINRKKNGALIVKIRGTRLALGKHITSYIEVKEEIDEKRN